MIERQPIPVVEIVAALEREVQDKTDFDLSSQWCAAQNLRRMKDWTDRTLMCRIDDRPSTIQPSGVTPGDGT